MKKNILNFYVIVFVLFSACSGDGGNKSTQNKGMIPTVSEAQSMKKESNAITKSLPTLMVVPSDGLLKRLNCLKSIENQGITAYTRDYKSALINDGNLKFVIAAIEEEFANVGYPLENLEQQLKMVDNINTMDETESIAYDLRTELMNTARPDYVIEIEYDLKTDTKSRNLEKSLTYIVKCLDVFTNKTVAAVTRADVGKGSGETSIAPIIKKDFPTTIKELQGTITSHYADILANGEEVTLRIAALENSNIALDDKCGDEEIGEQIINWLKENTVNSTYKMVKNTKTEMQFMNVRIYTSDENGNSYTAYDFAKDLRKALRSGCNIELVNRTQSIGDAYLQIEGVKY